MTFLQEGDLIQIKPGEEVYAEVPYHFIYEGEEGNWAETTETEIKVEGQFAFFAGKYLVYKTAVEGGGTGHGPGDIYPNGHHVYARKVGAHNVKVSFYQSGSFTIMKPDKKPIGKARIQWVIDE